MTSRSSIDRQKIKCVVNGTFLDEQTSEEDIRQLAQAFEHEDDGENLRFADLVSESCNVLLENLKFLAESLGRGGKKSLAIELQVDPTTVSRWLSGSYEPQPSSLSHLINYFGLKAGTDLKREPVFLSAEPVAQTQRRSWLHSRIDSLSSNELRDLFPALRRILEDR